MHARPSPRPLFLMSLASPDACMHAPAPPPQLDNILLKSAPSQPRGYISKLGDFGAGPGGFKQVASGWVVFAAASCCC